MDVERETEEALQQASKRKPKSLEATRAQCHELVNDLYFHVLCHRVRDTFALTRLLVMEMIGASLRGR